MNRIVIVARLKEGAGPRAAELIGRGPPFDLAEAGITRHHVFLSACEVLFLFEGAEVEWTLEDLVAERPFPLGQALEEWREIADGPPRIARERFCWRREEPSGATAAEEPAAGWQPS